MGVFRIYANYLLKVQRNLNTQAGLILNNDIESHALWHY